jgi:hypothetical protein
MPSHSHSVDGIQRLIDGERAPPGLSALEVYLACQTVLLESFELMLHILPALLCTHPHRPVCPICEHHASPQ